MRIWITETIELLEKISEGSEGEVWKANWHRDPNGSPKKIAVKLGTKGDRPGKRMEKEIENLRGIDHSAIVRLRVYGETKDGTPFHGTDLVLGKTLYEYLAFHGSPLKQNLAISIAAQITSAVDSITKFINQTDGDRDVLVHGDIAPQNVMITNSNQVKIVDFGCSRLESIEAPNSSKKYARSVFYCDPNVDDSGASRITEMFSIGAILFKILTGKEAISREIAGVPGKARDFYKPLYLKKRRQQLEDCDVSQENIDLVEGLLSKNNEDRLSSYKKLLNHKVNSRKLYGDGEEILWFKPKIENNPSLSIRKIAAVLIVGFSLLAVQPAIGDYLAAISWFGGKKEKSPKDYRVAGPTIQPNRNENSNSPQKSTEYAGGKKDKPATKQSYSQGKKKDQGGDHIAITNPVVSPSPSINFLRNDEIEKLAKLEDIEVDENTPDPRNFIERQFPALIEFSSADDIDRNLAFDSSLVVQHKVSNFYSNPSFSDAKFSFSGSENSCEGMKIRIEDVLAERGCGESGLGTCGELIAKVESDSNCEHVQMEFACLFEVGPERVFLKNCKNVPGSHQVAEAN